MHYKRISGEYFGEPHAKQVDKVKKARRNLEIACWTILVFGMAALGFFSWIIYYVLTNYPGAPGFSSFHRIRFNSWKSYVPPVIPDWGNLLPVRSLSGSLPGW